MISSASSCPTSIFNPPNRSELCSLIPNRLGKFSPDVRRRLSQLWLKPRAGHRRVLYRLLLTLSALEFVKVLGGKEVNIAAFGARLQELAKQVNVFGA